MMERNITRILSITLFVLIYLFGWLAPSFAGDSPWPMFQAAINAGKNNIIPDQSGTVTSKTGRIWMDRNLGASRVATSMTDSAAYGDLYQWGRGKDGHEKRNSPTTSIKSTTDVPGHGSFITVGRYDSPYDWRVSRNNNLWQGVAGTNNPCPPGFRLPTSSELDTERLSWSSNNFVGAFGSPLKLVMAGFRKHESGAFGGAGSVGYYWSSTVGDSFVEKGKIGIYRSSTVGGVKSRPFVFDSYVALMYYGFGRAYGFSARCLKD